MVYGVYMALLIHQKFLKSPAYYYLYDYDGSVNFPEMLYGLTYEIHGNI